MKRIRNLRELKQAWADITLALWRDLGAMARLATDPAGTLRELGYEMSPEAQAALLRAMP